MRKLITTITLLCSISLVYAQFYTFEDGVVPSSEWQTTGTDALAISQEHYKDDNYSLCWTTSGNTALNVTFSSTVITSSDIGASFHVYSTAVSNDLLKVEFIAPTNLVIKTANFKLNYKGWRDFSRRYNEYASTGLSEIAKVRFTLIPRNGNGTRTIYFDRMEFNTAVPEGRTISTPWVEDMNYLNKGKNVLSSLRLFALTNTIPATPATASEIQAMDLLRSRLEVKPSRPTNALLNTAIAFADGLNITRNVDGSVKGKMIDNSPAALTTEVMANYALQLEAIAYDHLVNPTDNIKRQRFNNFLDHLIEQGIAEGCAFSIRSNNYSPSKIIPKALLGALPACSDTQKTELIKLVRWISHYYSMYYSDADYLQNLNSDIVYLYLDHFSVCAVYHPDTNIAVRELKTLKRFLERNTQYVPGGRDILKPDGTGFHHGTHYNNYMYSYQTWVNNLYLLRGTPFQTDAESYHRFKKAILSIYRMATNSTSDAQRFYALSLAGRNPFASGQSLFFSKPLFENLIDLSGSILGTIDEELAGAYNYFYKSNKYAVPELKQEGFYQFNYSPAAIYRKNNWVVTMRAPTTKFWGGEIYSEANRFGRYQSHGTLEVMYPGTLMKSGYPTNATGGGWDWNMPQGGTTVKYSTWDALMPKGNTTARFDQYAKTSNFAGALAWGDKGIFAADFDQDDKWGSPQLFTPTNLKFKKSMFAYDGVIVSLGSDIEAQGYYNSHWPTLTTLFQNLYSSTFSTQSFVVNGIEVTAAGYTTLLDANVNNWMISPASTGYLLPKGNNSTTVSFETQKTPKENGSDYQNPITSATAAKCYINHGIKPSNGSYEFLVVPAATNGVMQEWAQNYANRIRINRKNSKIHSVTFLQDNTHAYTFFNDESGLTFGNVKSANGRLLLMEKADATTSKIEFAASCPDLNPINDVNYGWRSTPKSTDIVLSGEWVPAEAVNGVHFSTPAYGETVVNLTFSDGNPLYFSAKKNNTGIERHEQEALFSYEITDGACLFKFKAPSVSDRFVSLYTIEGKRVFESKISGNETTYSIKNIPANQVFLICKLSASEYSFTFKMPLSVR